MFIDTSWIETMKIVTQNCAECKIFVFGIHNDSRFKILNPPYQLYFSLIPPFWTTKWFLLDLPTLPPPEYLWTLPKKKLCSKMCFISLRIRQKLEMWLFFFFCQIWNINIQLKDNSLWYFATRTPLFDIYDFH